MPAQLIYRPLVPSLAQGLIRWYSFDDGTAFDFGTQRQIGTLNSSPIIAGGIAPGTTIGRRRGSLLFNGTTSYVSMPTTGLPSGASAGSITAWVYFISFNNANQIISYGTGGSTDQVRGLQSGFDGTNQVFIATYWADDIADTTAVVTGKWYHVANVYDGTTGYLYVNGVLKDSAARTLNTVLTGAEIGRELDGTSHSNARIDDVRYYNRALSAGEVFAIYAEAFQSQIPLRRVGIVQTTTLFGSQQLLMM